MSRGAPGSQTRSLMVEKERIACRLLQQGLTITQICRQLKCSPHFVRRVRRELECPEEIDHPEGSRPVEVPSGV
ncbi:MAG TPA: helix-turn-helix domain-containing protein [Chloroflexota bacterium]|nr:helix-turn-helix domain-containing protein [Chloroflexota bacterium]